MKPTMMTLLILTVVVAPFVIVGSTLAENADRLGEFARGVIARGPPEPPAWVSRIPLIGERAAAYGSSLAYDTGGVLEELRRFVDPAREFAFRAGAVVGEGLLQLTLSVLIAFFFYRHGRQMLVYVRESSESIAGPRAGAC